RYNAQTTSDRLILLTRGISAMICRCPCAVLLVLLCPMGAALAREDSLFQPPEQALRAGVYFYQQAAQAAQKELASQQAIHAYNSALALAPQRKYDAGIAEYRKLLASDANDEDAGGHLMEAYRNYHNSAAKGISRCLERKGDFTGALNWVLQARDKYPYRSWC